MLQHTHHQHRPAHIAAQVTASASGDERAWLDKLSSEMLYASSAAQDDERSDFLNLAAGAKRSDVSRQIAANLTFGAEHRRLTVPDAEPHGETYNQIYASEYRRLRRARLANGGKLPTDPGQAPAWARGGRLTDREVALRAAALAAIRA